MGVYRIHAGGAWSSNKEENKYMENIEFYECMEKYFRGNTETGKNDALSVPL